MGDRHFAQQQSSGPNVCFGLDDTPGVTRAAVLRDPAIVADIGQFAVIQSVAPSVGVDVTPVNLGNSAEIERAVAAFHSRSAPGFQKRMMPSRSAAMIASARPASRARPLRRKCSPCAFSFAVLS